jgi:hypothetical protein
MILCQGFQGMAGTCLSFWAWGSEVAGRRMAMATSKLIMDLKAILIVV